MIDNRLQHKIVFDLIRRYDLYNVIHKMIISLIQLDQERAFQILLNKRKIASEIVVYELQGHQKYLYLVSAAYVLLNSIFNSNRYLRFLLLCFHSIC